jgi:hypothetical protein
LRHGFPLPEFADLETLSCQGNFRADAARTDGQGRELHISGRQPAVPQQASNPAGSSKEGGGIPPSAIGNRRAGNHKRFTFCSRWVN